MLLWGGVHLLNVRLEPHVVLAVVFVHHHVAFVTGRVAVERLLARRGHLTHCLGFVTHHRRGRLFAVTLGVTVDFVDGVAEFVVLDAGEGDVVGLGEVHLVDQVVDDLYFGRGRAVLVVLPG